MKKTLFALGICCTLNFYACNNAEHQDTDQQDSLAAAAKADSMLQDALKDNSKVDSVAQDSLFPDTLRK